MAGIKGGGFRPNVGDRIMTSKGPRIVGAIPASKKSMCLVPKYWAREQGRVYLEVLVTPNTRGWCGHCNGKRAVSPSMDGPVTAAWKVSEIAFAEYFDRNVSWHEIRLERETDWEYVASMPDIQQRAEIRS
jgi:hypothetical protein